MKSRGVHKRCVVIKSITDKKRAAPKSFGRHQGTARGEEPAPRWLEAKNENNGKKYSRGMKKNEGPNLLVGWSRSASNKKAAQKKRNIKKKKSVNHRQRRRKPRRWTGKTPRDMSKLKK